MTEKPNCLPLLFRYFTQSGKIYTLLFMFFVSVGYGQTLTMERGLPIAEIQPPPGVTPTIIDLSDTQGQSMSTGPWPIGFWFPFYGGFYNKFYLDKRGFLSFTDEYFREGTPMIPSREAPNALIAFAYSAHNVLPNDNTVICNYFLTGTHPNRILVINYKNVPCENEPQRTFTQIQLYERGAKIEIHNTLNVSTVTPRTIGLEDYYGSTGLTEPNLNYSTQINSVNEMIRFSACDNGASITPSSQYMFPIGTAEEVFVTLTASCESGRLQWKYGETTSSVTIPLSVPLTTYRVDCFSSTCTSSAIADIQMPNLGISGGEIYCNGWNVALYLSDTQIYDATTKYQWKKNGVNIPGATRQGLGISGAGDYTCEIIDDGHTFSTWPYTVYDLNIPESKLESTTFKFAWDKSFAGANNSTTLNPIGLKTADGGYLIASTSDSNAGNDKSEASLGGTDYWIVKTDSLGNKLWDKTYGTAYYDRVTSVIPTADGGYLIGGYYTEYPTYYWKCKVYLVKIGSNGNKLWEKFFTGGEFENILESVVETPDGGFLLGAFTSGAVWGDKTDRGYGSFDYWVIKTDANGNKLWDKSYGGSDFERIKKIIKTSDGGYLLGGLSYSAISGLKTAQKKGFSDYWIIKIAADGTKLWDKAFGGAMNDYDYFSELTSLIQTSDGGFLLGGHARAPYAGGDKSEASVGMEDYWVVKTDASGNKLWDKTIGWKREDKLVALAETKDGGYLLAGNTENEVVDPFRETDFWIVKLSGTGVKLWDKTVSTIKTDKLSSLILENNGKFILVGDTDSGISNDKTVQKKSYTDAWMIKVNEVDSGAAITLKKDERFSTDLKNTCSGTVYWNNQIAHNRQFIYSMNNTNYMSYSVYCRGLYCVNPTNYVTFNKCGNTIDLASQELVSIDPNILNIKATNDLSASKRILKGNVVFNAGKAIYLNPGFSTTPGSNYFKAEIIDVPCP